VISTERKTPNKMRHKRPYMCFNNELFRLQFGQFTIYLSQKSKKEDAHDLFRKDIEQIIAPMTLFI